VRLFSLAIVARQLKPVAAIAGFPVSIARREHAVSFRRAINIEDLFAECATATNTANLT
jgi:hypothetical protein